MDQQTAGHLARLLRTAIVTARALGGQHGVRHYRLTLADGREAFAKVQYQDGNVAAGLAAEASALAILAEPDAMPVPPVLAADDTCLVTGSVEAASPDPAAVRFGADLAALHQAGPGRFGAPYLDLILAADRDQALDAAGQILGG